MAVSHIFALDSSASSNIYVHLYCCIKVELKCGSRNFGLCMSSRRFEMTPDFAGGMGVTSDYGIKTIIYSDTHRFCGQTINILTFFLSAVAD